VNFIKGNLRRQDSEMPSQRILKQRPNFLYPERNFTHRSINFMGTAVQPTPATIALTNHVGHSSKFEQSGKSLMIPLPADQPNLSAAAPVAAPKLTATDEKSDNTSLNDTYEEPSSQVFQSTQWLPWHHFHNHAELNQNELSNEVYSAIKSSKPFSRFMLPD